MRLCLAVMLTTAGLAFADWPTFGADPQRTGWARGETILNKETARTLELKWKLHVDNAPKQLTSLAAPIVVDQVKTGSGIKEFVIVAGSSDKVFAIDADAGKLVWQKSFTAEATPTGRMGTLCPFALNATPVVQSTRPKTVHVLSSDGRLHSLSAVDGEDRLPPKQFVPAFSKNWSLNIAGGMLYTAVGQRCNGVMSGVYSMDLNDPAKPVHYFEAGRPGIWGRGGVAISPSTGMVFAETGDGSFDPAAGSWADSFLALNGKDLKLADYYTPLNRGWLTRKDLDMGNITPVVFALQGKEYVAGAGKEGRIYILDAASVGGETHRQPKFRSELLNNEDAAYAAQGFWGSFATWEDSKGARWLFAPAWGRANPKAQPFPKVNGEALHGSIMAFRVELKDGAPTLVPAWISRDLNVPEPPIIANGVIYALSSGDGVPQDYAEAARWYRKAANQGLVTAESQLGTMYGMGLGVPHDLVAAAYWTKRAAEQGSARSLSG